MNYRIPFNRPTLIPEALNCVSEVVRSGRLSGNGPFTHACEKRLRELTSAYAALLTSSCTSALEMAALMLDSASRRRGDRPLVHVRVHGERLRDARVHAGLCRLPTRHPERRRSDDRPSIGPRTRAIVVMHYGGVACEMDGILALASRHNLVVVEDNAHGLFAKYQGRPLGSLGSIATQSFHETKNVTSGEGGALS